MSTVACVVASAVASCDPGTPPSADQMRSLGLPVESALRVNEETVVTVHMEADSPELLIYTPNRFGGAEVEEWPAMTTDERAARIGNGFSLGPYNEDRNERDPGFCYVFGAGQGPIEDVVVDDAAARGQIVNDEIGAWVIVMPEDAELSEVDWQLIGPGGEVIYAGRGFPGRSYLCAQG